MTIRMTRVTKTITYENEAQALRAENPDGKFRGAPVENWIKCYGLENTGPVSRLIVNYVEVPDPRYNGKTVREHITDIIAGADISAVPNEIRDQVVRGAAIRRARHEGHSETINGDRTITVTNDTLRVTLPLDEYHGRYNVFHRAMRMMGNSSEHELLLREGIPENEIEHEAFECLRDEWIIENTRYSPSEVLMRLNGGHRMSEGMRADVSAACIHAARELRENRTAALASARASIQIRHDAELKYRSHYARDCEGWKIEIIGVMPEQIGLCRYSHEVTV